MVPKLIEGFDAIYITGSGQTKQTADRVKIYEVEGDVLPTKRFKWKARDEFPLDATIMSEDIQQPPRRIYKKRATVKKESLTGMVKPSSGRGGAVIRGKGKHSQTIVSLPRRESSDSSHERAFPQQSSFHHSSKDLSVIFPQSHVPCQIFRKQELLSNRGYEPQNSWFTDPVLFSQSYSTWTSLGLHLPDDEWDSQRDMEETDSGSDSSTTLSYSTSSPLHQ